MSITTGVLKESCVPFAVAMATALAVKVNAGKAVEIVKVNKSKCNEANRGCDTVTSYEENKKRRSFGPTLGRSVKNKPTHNLNDQTLLWEVTSAHTLQNR